MLAVKSQVSNMALWVPFQVRGLSFVRDMYSAGVSYQLPLELHTADEDSFPVTESPSGLGLVNPLYFDYEGLVLAASNNVTSRLALIKEMRSQSVWQNNLRSTIRVVHSNYTETVRSLTDKGIKFAEECSEKATNSKPLENLNSKWVEIRDKKLPTWQTKIAEALQGVQDRITKKKKKCEK